MKTFTGILCALLLGLLTAGGAGAAIYTFPGTPVAILDGDYLYADIIDVDDPGVVADVNVFVDVTHSDISDLDIYLAHQESGGATWKYVQLFNQYGGPGDSLAGVTFDDEAMTCINLATSSPRWFGTFKPGSTYDEYADSNLLSFFDGDDIAGTWSLAIWDGYSGDTGTLNAFSIDVTPVPIPGAIWLLGSGIIGLVGFSRKLRS